MEAQQLGSTHDHKAMMNTGSRTKQWSLVKQRPGNGVNSCCIQYELCSTRSSDSSLFAHLRKLDLDVTLVTKN